MPDDVASLHLRIISDQVDQATRRLTALEEASRGTEDQTRRTTRATSDLGSAFSKAGAIAQGALAVMGVGAVGLAAGLGTATQNWLKFDKAMKEVNSITSQTRAQFKGMRTDVLQMSAALGTDATTAASGLYQALSAGVPRENALQFMEIASKAAIGGVTEVNVAVDGLTNTINAFKIPLSDTSLVADKLFATVVYGKTTFEELSGSMSVASVPAAALGISLDELLASVVGITSQGTPTSEAFTQIKATINALLDPSEEMVSVYDQMGVASGRAAIAQFGLAGTLEQVRQSYASNDAALVKALRSSEAYNGVLSLTGDNLKKMVDSTEQVRNSSGSMSRAFAENSATLENSLNSVKASAVLLIEQMEASMGVIAAFGQALQGIAGMISSLSGGGISEATSGILGNAGALGVQQLEARNKQLHMFKTQLEWIKKESGDGAMMTNIFTTEGKEIEAMIEDGVLGRFANFSSAEEALQKVNSEIEKIKGGLAAATPETKALAGAMGEVNLLQKQRDAGLITEEEFNKKRKEQLALLEKEKTVRQIMSESDKKDLIQKEAAAAAESERRAKAIETAKEEERLQGEENKRMKEAGKMAAELATTEEERLKIKQSLVEQAIKAGTVDAATGKEAIAVIQEQIRLLDEKAIRTGGGGGGSGGSGGGGASATSMAVSAFEDSLPELDYQKQNETEFERLEEQERMLQESYNKRREIILESTALTESQRLALLIKTEGEYTAAQRDLEEARQQATLDSVQGFLGDIQNAASAFGKKGAKAAKAAAIASATIDMYSNAVKAYGRGLEIPYIGAYVAPVFAAAALAAGAANISKISSTDYAGAYEHGGMIPAGKYGMVGEAGPELVQGPAMVTSARTTEGRDSGGQKAMQTNVTIINNAGVQVERKESRTDDKEFLEFVLNATEQRVAERIERGGSPIPASLERVYPLNRGARGNRA